MRKAILFACVALILRRACAADDAGAAKSGLGFGTDAASAEMKRLRGAPEQRRQRCAQTRK